MSHMTNICFSHGNSENKKKIEKEVIGNIVKEQRTKNT